MNELANSRTNAPDDDGKGNGLRRLAGTWTAEEFRDFEESVALFEEVDAELWQ